MESCRSAVPLSRFSISALRRSTSLNWKATVEFNFSSKLDLSALTEILLLCFMSFASRFQVALFCHHGF
uniref:Uncharacterized protein n=1 Tax=Ciona intestinalis TaxID=7719 RepID=H2XZ72_CIOIN